MKTVKSILKLWLAGRPFLAFFAKPAVKCAKIRRDANYFASGGTRIDHPSETPGCFAIDPTYSEPPGRACSVLVDECNSYGTLFSFTANSTAGGAGKRCDGTIISPAATYTLSSAGESYLDVDGKRTYKLSELNSNAALIDLVAYYNSSYFQW